MTYRPDIDGLRAVAVLGVLVYHLQPPSCPGGFVGVDVFFVISGYLITGILWRQLQEGRFSIKEFYRRRIRRIFPALFVLLGVWTGLGIAFLMPPELAEFGQSLAAAAGSAANLFFWSDTDYFATAAERRWLLHTWSLGVEEQFYIALPLAMWALSGHATRMKAALSVATVASFAAAAWLVYDAPTAAFYGPHLRAWELLIGSLLSLGVVRIPAHRYAREVLAVIGISLIGYAYSEFNWETVFPGASALVPCLGTALLIGTGPDTLVGRALSWRPFVGVGLISYSLYLWHWPLIVLWNHPAVEIPSALRGENERMATLFIASMVLAYLSWRFVEQPFRKSREDRRPEIPVGLGAVAVAVILGVGLWQSGGFPQRLPANVAKMAAWATPASRSNNRLGQCFITSTEVAEDYDIPVCLGEGHSDDVLLMGDSHGAQLYEGLAANTERFVRQATGSGCKPTLPLRGQDRCTQTLDKAMLHAEEHPPGRVVIAGRWQWRDIDGLKAMVTYWRERDVPVVVIGRTVEYTHDLPLLLAYETHGRRNSVRRHRELRPRLDGALRAAAEESGASYLSLQEAICGKPGCVVVLGATPLQFDYGHFTTAGSKWIGRSILAVADRAEAPPVDDTERMDPAP